MNQRRLRLANSDGQDRSTSWASGPAAERLHRELLDDRNILARRRFTSTLTEVLRNVASWLAVDSWLGAGKVEEPDRREAYGVAYDEFRAAATVICMSSELASAAEDANEARRTYAVAAIVRQLIECEYLLTLFTDDLAHAQRWRSSTPEQIRSEFTPQKMRYVTGFSNAEYWNHCRNGGHPTPQGARLLEWLDPGRRSWPFAREELAIDLNLHLHRIWRRVDHLLCVHHARFERVRAHDRVRAERAWDEWIGADPIVEEVKRYGWASASESTPRTPR